MTISRMQNSNKPSEYGEYRQICTWSGTYIEYLIGFTNLAPNRALYGIGSALSRDGTQLGTQFVYLIRYTFYVPPIRYTIDVLDWVHNLYTWLGTHYMIPIGYTIEVLNWVHNIHCLCYIEFWIISTCTKFSYRCLTKSTQNFRQKMCKPTA